LVDDVPEMDPAEALGALEMKDALRAAGIVDESPVGVVTQRDQDMPVELKSVSNLRIPSPGVGQSKSPFIDEISKAPTVGATSANGKQKEENNITNKTSGTETKPGAIGVTSVAPYSVGNAPSPNMCSETSKGRRQMHAWTTAVSPVSARSGVAITIDQVHMADKELEGLIVDDKSLIDSLSELNGYQRQLIVDHVLSINSTLEHVRVWKHERLTTVFGELNLVILLWVTTRPSDDESKFKSERFFRKRDAEKGVTTGAMGRGHNQTQQSITASDHEDFANRKMEQNYEANAKPVINFKDCLGRKFIFPFELVRTWPVSLSELEDLTLICRNSRWRLSAFCVGMLSFPSQ
jgi:hypothetical protein